MRQARVERRLFDLSARLATARHDLAVLEEQTEVFEDSAEDAKVRALVAEDRSQVDADAGRHAEAMRRASTRLAASIAQMERTQEELISRLTSKL
ncbi:MAG: hypothetical protein ACRDX8_02655 [Acidimicrobiales bacterium]